MGNEKVFGWIDARPLIWVHYVLLVGLLFLGFYVGDAILQLSQQNLLGMFFFWLVLIGFGDQAIHYVLKVD